MNFVNDEGRSNSTLVSEMKTSNSFSDSRFELAFSNIDRGDFFPYREDSSLYHDTPIKHDLFHQSAPSIYANAINHFRLFKSKDPQRSNMQRGRRRLSFLNVGSGTGYFQALMDYLLCMEDGDIDVNCANIEVFKPSHGIDIQPSLIDHALQCVLASKATPAGTPPPEFTCTGADCINTMLNITYDRIYIGAGAPLGSMDYFVSLLAPGGVLIGPFGSHLLCVEKDLLPDASGLYPTAHTSIASVAFAPLTRFNTPQLEIMSSRNYNVESHCVLEPCVWSPHSYVHSTALPSFRAASLCLLCISVRGMQAAGRVPGDIWFEVLSYCHREWFEVPVDELSLLRTLLAREREAKVSLEKRLLSAESERDQAMTLCMIFNRRLIAMQQQLQAGNNVARAMDVGGDDDDGDDGDDDDDDDEDEVVDMRNEA